MKDNVKRAMDNFSRVPNFTTILNIDEVNYWLENFSDLIFCNGHGRRVVFDKLTDKNYKVYTRSI